MRSRLRLVAAGVLGVFVLASGVAASQVATPNTKTVCATATASTPPHVVHWDRPPLDGQPLPRATYTIPGDTATATECVTVTADTVTETVTTPGPTTTVTETVTVEASARRVLWGASFAPAPAHHGTNSREAETVWFEEQIGEKADVVRHYLGGPGESWTGDGALRAIIAGGRVPLFSFGRGGHTYTEIAAGAADAALRARFNEILTASDPLWHEAIIGFVNEPENEPGIAANYVAAFEHIIALADQVGLPNKWTTFLMEYSWQGSGGDPEAWIPPSVDYLGVHGYANPVGGNCNGVDGGRRSFYDVFDAPHATAVKLGKRMLVGEFGQREDRDATPNPAAKADWFRAIPSDLERLPYIDVVSYWHSGGGEGGFHGDCEWEGSFRIDSTRAALQGYIDASRAPILGG
jgi:hypothetical protein